MWGALRETCRQKNFTAMDLIEYYMHLDKQNCRKITTSVFLTTTLLTTYFLQTLNFTDLLTLTGALFTTAITDGI